MEAFRFIHAADLHLDSPFAGLTHLPEAVRRRVRQSTFRAFQRLVELCIHKNVDFLLIAGDVYDGKDRSIQAQIEFQRGVQRLAEQGIHTFVVHGNHDPLDGYQALLSWPDRVHFFSGQDVETIPFVRNHREIARISGISYPTGRVLENYARRFRRDPDSPYHIAMLHTNVDGDPNHDDYAPCRMGNLLDAGMDYWALGHIHQRNVLYQDPHVVYPGNLQARHVGETGAKGAYEVQVSETGTTALTFHPLDAIRWHHTVISIQDLQQEQELLDRVREETEAIRERAEERACIVRFEFQGRGPLHSFLQKTGDIEDVREQMLDEERHKEHFVWMEPWVVRTERQVNREEWLAEENLVGDLLRYIQQAYTDEATLEEIRQEVLAPLFNKNRRASTYLGTPEDREIQEWMKRAEEMAMDFLLKEEESG